MITSNGAARPFYLIAQDSHGVEWQMFQSLSEAEAYAENARYGYIMVSVFYAADYDALREERDELANKLRFVTILRDELATQKTALVPMLEVAEAKVSSVGEWIAKTQTKATALQCARNQTDRDTGHVIETMLGYVRAALNEGEGK